MLEGEVTYFIAEQRQHLQAMVLSATAEAIRDVGTKTAKRFSDFLEDDVMLSPAERQRINYEVGAEAQQSVLRSYRQMLSKNRSQPGYRATVTDEKFRRYAGGRLYAALNDPQFFTATSEGLYFINVDLLNERAKQWARLNFGAGPAGTGSTDRYPMYFAGQLVATLGFDAGPRPAFTMPAGYFTENGKAFYPTRRHGRNRYWQGEGPQTPNKRSIIAGLPKGARAKYSTVPTVRRVSQSSVPEGNWVSRGTATKGIRAGNFLDAGLATIAGHGKSANAEGRGLLGRYDAAINAAYRNAGERFPRGPGQRVTATPGRRAWSH